MGNYAVFYTTQAYVSEAQRHGIKNPAPDINGKQENYTASDRERWIRVGLCQSKDSRHMPAGDSKRTAGQGSFQALQTSLREHA